MENHAIKVKRSRYFFKLLMLVTVGLFVNQYYQTKIFDLGEFASTVAILSLLRGLMLSAFIFTSPIQSWFASNIGLNSDSNKYFLLAIVLGVVGFL
ncbi:hypothetical protein J7384_18390 [Endozoicomonas sp. G2_1]|uniref:hypothetical protein n=1 Tax=Endozoicomonas sp. G2_1 TaxID=2821091 RepID=UPI001ADCBE4B|nr:hypothetical protein [Endozoicomonas sp. G2_1]MBO9492337.1 hypothetical protein [Endozoicomonas sp. G2_1]